VDGRSIRALICDLDGLLVDSERLWSGVDELFFAPLVGGSEAWRTYAPVWEAARRRADAIGTMIDDVRRRFALTEDIEALRQRREDVLLARYRVELRERPGATALLESCAASGIPVAIGSGASPRIIRTVLEVLRWQERVRAIASTHETGRGKPDPGVFLLAAERLGVAPATCLVLENDASGYAAAVAARMAVLVVPDTAERLEQCRRVGAQTYGSLTALWSEAQPMLAVP
jgi:HAD superfamily hydrolase (TIGR01509 family)